MSHFENINFDLDITDPVNHKNRVVSSRPLQCPFEIAIDTREQAPWHFMGLQSDSRTKFRPLVVNTETRTLPTGDYSIVGLESEITLERKSKPDACATFTTDRERFERELNRMQQMRWAAVIIECDWADLAAGPQRVTTTDLHSQLIGKTICRSILAWQQRFPRVHWLLLPSRQDAMDTAFRILERYWLDRQHALKTERNLI